MRNKYSAEFNKFMIENSNKYTLKELIEIAETKGYNMTPDAMRNYLLKRGIHHKNYNCTKAHGKPKRKIGYEFDRGDGFILVKQEDGTYERKQRIIYEQNYRKLKEGEMVIFLDGDRTNLDPKNLRAVSSSSYLIARNKHLLNSNDPELIKVALLIGELTNETKRVKRILNRKIN